MDALQTAFEELQLVNQDLVAAAHFAAVKVDLSFDAVLKNAFAYTYPNQENYY